METAKVVEMYCIKLVRDDREKFYIVHPRLDILKLMPQVALINGHRYIVMCEPYLCYFDCGDGCQFDALVLMHGTAPAQLCRNHEVADDSVVRYAKLFIRFMDLERISKEYIADQHYKEADSIIQAFIRHIDVSKL